jgi:hypothetical protein
VGTDGTYPDFVTPLSRKEKLVNVPSVTGFPAIYHARNGWGRCAAELTLRWMLRRLQKGLAEVSIQLIGTEISYRVYLSMILLRLHLRMVTAMITSIHYTLEYNFDHLTQCAQFTLLSTEQLPRADHGVHGMSISTILTCQGPRG